MEVTGISDGGLDGVAVVEEELHQPRRYVSRRARHANNLPHSAAHLCSLPLSLSPSLKYV